MIIELLTSSLSILFFMLSAISNSLMDTVADKTHFEKSILSKLNPEFWLKTDSWDNKYIDTDGDGEGEVESGFVFKGLLGFLNNFLDGWHIFQMIMIIMAALSVITFKYSFEVLIFKYEILNQSLHLIIYGAAWNWPFNLFYKKILKK